jgi:hypothetical protein
MEEDPSSDAFYDEQELTTMFSDTPPFTCRSFDVCGADPCQACMQHLTTVFGNCKRLLTENKELVIKHKDRVQALTGSIELLELHNEQKQRLLDKQTQLVEILSKERSVNLDGIAGLEEYTATCDRCVYHRDMWRRIRSINLEQQKRCEMESGKVRAIQQQQGRQLAQMKMMVCRLRTQYDELLLRKDDPFCRDSEILKLRRDLEEAKAMTAGYNRTAFNANNEARMFMEQLDREKAQCSELRAEVSALKSDVSLHKEMVEVLRQTASPESKEARQLFVLGECRDLVCRNRMLASSHKTNMLVNQLNEARERCEQLKEELSRSRIDTSHWRKLYDATRAPLPPPPKTEPQALVHWDFDPNVAIPAICLNEKEEEDHHPPIIPQPLAVNQQVVHVMEQKTKPLVANISPRDDLTMRLQSLFELIPGMDAEMDENDMYDEFMLDQEHHRREQTLEEIFASCHSGAALPENERKRFRQAVTTKNNSIRSCKRSFSACLRAIGGVMVKKRSRNIWLNFRQTRAPIFKWCEHPH